MNKFLILASIVLLSLGISVQAKDLPDESKPSDTSAIIVGPGGSVASAPAEADLLKCFIRERNVNKASILMRTHPITIEIGRSSHAISFSISFCGSGCGGGCGGNMFQVDKSYESGLKALKRRHIKEAERQFEIATNSSNYLTKELAFLGLAKCYQIEDNNTEFVNSLADFFEINDRYGYKY